jgi:hypothetical protein
MGKRMLKKLRPFDFRRVKDNGSSVDRLSMSDKKKRPVVLEVARPQWKRQPDDEGPVDLGRPTKVRKVTVCKDLDEEEKTACLALSRLVSRGMRQELKAGMSSQDVCQKLQEQNLIKLGDPSGTSPESSI